MQVQQPTPQCKAGFTPLTYMYPGVPTTVLVISEGPS